jgi:hypothetical protein
MSSGPRGSTRTRIGAPGGRGDGRKSTMAGVGEKLRGSAGGDGHTVAVVAVVYVARYFDTRRVLNGVAA